MKFTLDRKTIMEHVVLSAPHDIAETIAETPLWKDEEAIEAKLTMNGIDVPVEVLEKVLQNMWEQCQEKTGVSEFNRKVKAEAERIVKEKADDVMEAFQEIQSKLESANDLVKWEWEK